MASLHVETGDHLVTEHDGAVQLLAAHQQLVPKMTTETGLGDVRRRFAGHCPQEWPFHRAHLDVFGLGFRLSGVSCEDRRAPVGQESAATDRKGCGTRAMRVGRLNRSTWRPAGEPSRSAQHAVRSRVRADRQHPPGPIRPGWQSTKSLRRANVIPVHSMRHCLVVARIEASLRRVLQVCATVLSPG